VSRDPEAADLEAEVLAWMEQAPAGWTVPEASPGAARFGLDAAATQALEARFEALAARLFAFQFTRLPAYAAYARARDRTPSNTHRSCDIPPLPVSAFKETRVATFDPALDRVRFHTSGTTESRPGALHLASLRLYESSLRRGFRHHVIPDRDRMRMISLVPDRAAAPHSSLSYMLEDVRQECGAPGSIVVHDGELDWRRLRAGLDDAIRSREPVCILGTGFLWVHVLDACEAEGVQWRLPPGSRAFETGGTKGRTRVLQRDQLARGIERCFGIPPTHLVSEYGMTEMASQYYTSDLRHAVLGLAPPPCGWSHPAWVRPRLMDAETGHLIEMPEAREIGLLVHHDLANVESVAALATADLGAPEGGSFALRGRAPRADPRGCGLVHEQTSVRR
jgi:hypothetical protein